MGMSAEDPKKKEQESLPKPQPQTPTAEIKPYQPNKFGQMKELVNILPEGIGATAGGVKLFKFFSNIVFNAINDATTIITSMVYGPDQARDAEGILKTPSEITDAGMNTILNIAPTPDKYLKVSPVKVNASKFSSINKGNAVLKNSKSEVGTVIRKTNNATIDASEALVKSSKAISVTSGIGNIRQEIEREEN